MHSKAYLEKVIYEIHQASSFFLTSKAWSSPTHGFSYDQSRSIKYMDALMKAGLVKEKRSDVICILGDWENVAEGIIFTDKALYVKSPKNRSKNFRVCYSEIAKINYDSASVELKISTRSNSVFYIDTPMWSKRNIKIFLEVASGIMEFDDEDRRRLKQIELPKQVHESFADIAAGTVYGNVSNASTLYGQDKFGTPRGHGFAAERANHLFDMMTGKDAKIIGDDNAKYGADRVVKGINIQSKYCNSGSKCIQECFENGRLKYINADGSPMQIEVPSDKYEAAISAMENRITKGEVSGVTDPAEAKNIVRKGHFTYEQARNIAKFGTVESITYDAVNGAVISTYAFGISTVLSFAVSVLNDEDLTESLKKASYSGLKVGGTTFVTAVLSSQLSKAGLNSLLVGSSEAIVNVMGPKASAMLVNALRSGTNIYGAAAMKSAAKLLRSNAITAGVSIVVLSSVDVVNIFRGRISGTQLFKNITNTAASVGGGAAGWVGGAAAGAAIGSAVPIIGTAIGGFVGGLAGAFAGGSLAGKASDSLLGVFIEDDAKQMIEIIEKSFIQLAEDYLLNKTEAERIIDALKEDLTGASLKDMFASSDRQTFAQNLLVPHIENEVRTRKRVNLPSTDQMIQGLRDVLEEIADQEQSIL
ncbi:hypothetical protein [Gorillibacterium timonense]|uniref:hypothetical protein n=1 Tax=Gorillibacterium timonense TaxID=1689269 RepID=UPI000AF25F4C|nr:hypothetical protein [Gorillibacterium timonense]